MSWDTVAERVVQRKRNGLGIIPLDQRGRYVVWRVNVVKRRSFTQSLAFSRNIGIDGSVSLIPLRVPAGDVLLEALTVGKSYLPNNDQGRLLRFRLITDVRSRCISTRGCWIRIIRITILVSWMMEGVHCRLREDYIPCLWVRILCLGIIRINSILIRDLRLLHRLMGLLSHLLWSNSKITQGTFYNISSAHRPYNSFNLSFADQGPYWHQDWY